VNVQTGLIVSLWSETARISSTRVLLCSLLILETFGRKSFNKTILVTVIKGYLPVAISECSDWVDRFSVARKCSEKLKDSLIV